MSEAVQHLRHHDPAGARIGQTIKVITKARGRTIRWLAAAVGIKESSLYDRLSGVTGITAPELERVAQALEVDPGVLFKDPQMLLGVKDDLESFLSPLALLPDRPLDGPEQLQIPFPPVLMAVPPP